MTGHNILPKSTSCVHSHTDLEVSKLENFHFC